jgi:hypothetical protein
MHLERELKRLKLPFLNPMSRMESVVVINNTAKTDGTESTKEKEIYFVFSAELSLDLGEPKTLKQAINRKDRTKWIPLVKSKFMNFKSRRVWKKVKRKKVKALRQKPLGTKWVFKVKVEQDGSKQYKFRCVTLGYLQIPDVDFTKTFSPFVSNSTIQIAIGVLLYKEKPKSWVLEMIDIKAAFLEADLD